MLRIPARTDGTQIKKNTQTHTHTSVQSARANQKAIRVLHGIVRRGMKHVLPSLPPPLPPVIQKKILCRLHATWYTVMLCLLLLLRRKASLAIWTLAGSSRGYSRLPKQLLPRASTDDERERYSTPWTGTGGGGSPLNAAKSYASRAACVKDKHGQHAVFSCDEA